VTVIAIPASILQRKKKDWVLWYFTFLVGSWTNNYAKKKTTVIHVRICCSSRLDSAWKSMAAAALKGSGSVETDGGGVG
jgi:hypothetical protein